jgi:plastocyanin/truncated hemoglobin YjbI
LRVGTISALAVIMRTLARLTIAATTILSVCHAGSAAAGPARPPGSERMRAPSTDRRPLFERLGGRETLEAVAEDFLAKVAADERLQLRLFDLDAAQLQPALVDLLCRTSGGPCKAAPVDGAALELVKAEVDALAEDLIAVMDNLAIATREQNDLLAALQPMRARLVTPAARLRPVTPEKLAVVSMMAGALRRDQGEARRLLDAAVVAGERGQRSYGEQLFSRAEALVGSEHLASAARAFRDGAPPPVFDRPMVVATDPGPQPVTSGGPADSDTVVRRRPGALDGVITVAGAPLAGFGVVTLTPEKGGAPRPPQHGVIEQRDRRFAPHVLAVPVGSTVAFPNFDRGFHNLFSRSAAQPFDLGMYKPGTQRTLKFDTAGIVRLGCNLHPGEASYIAVVDAPYYVIVGDGGSFRFQNLKPGMYTVRAWTEHSAEPVEMSLELREGDNRRTLDLAADAGDGPGPDKFGVSRGGEAPPVRTAAQ